MLTEMIHGTELINGEDRMTWKLGKKEFTVKSPFIIICRVGHLSKFSTFVGIECAS
jgi:hypothetical protein